MRIIVTNKNVDYGNFLVVRTLKDVDETVGSIDILVYHKSGETREEKVELLSKIKDRVHKLVYIRNKEHVEQAIQMIVVGSGGKYIDDEFFIESKEELSNLVKELDEVTALVELGGTNVLGDFLTRYLKNGSSDFNSSYLVVVKEAVQNLVKDFRQKELEVIQMSETATDLFSHSAKLISSIKEEEQTLKKAVSKLENSRNTLINQTVTRAPSIVFFQTVNYMKEKNIIRVKCIGSQTFLVSFMLGMRIYLESVVNVRPKLVFVFPTGEIYEKTYPEYPWVTQRSHREMQPYYNNVVFTNYPSKDVMTKLLDDADYDTFIVVDVLKNSSGHILNCRGGGIRYAVSSKHLISKFKLPVGNCFSSLSSIPGLMFTVPLYPNYPREQDQRERLYLRECKKFYDILYMSRKR